MLHRQYFQHLVVSGTFFCSNKTKSWVDATALLLGNAQHLYKHIQKYIAALLCISAFFFLPPLVQGQPLSASEWANGIDKKGIAGYTFSVTLVNQLVEEDSSHVFATLNEIEKLGENKSKWFWARFICIKATFMYKWGSYQKFSTSESDASESIKNNVRQLTEQSIQTAWQTGDEYLVANVCLFAGRLYISLGDKELALMYMMNAIKLNDKLGIENSALDYMVIGELLYHIKEYQQSIEFSKKAIEKYAHNKAGRDGITRQMWSTNTMALAYQRLFRYDSAMQHYKDALQIAKSLDSKIWEGILSGNMGQIFFDLRRYDSANIMFQKDLNESIEGKLYNNAANNLQWMARTQLALGNPKQALVDVRKAFIFLRIWPDRNYLRNTYMTAYETFKALHDFDSAFFYKTQHTALNDSIEKEISNSSLRLAKARMDNDRNYYFIQNLQKDKQKQLFFRNGIILVILLLSLIVYLVIHRRRQAIKMQLHRSESDKKMAEQEAQAARVQLTLFTQNLVEKTVFIEKLETQIENQKASREQHEIFTALTEQTILTEDDWQRFKQLFEIIHPSFFKRLLEHYPDITVSETRTAALIKLSLTSKQIASILGISVDSVHKSRQRLRQRLHVEGKNDLEELIEQL